MDCYRYLITSQQIIHRPCFSSSLLPARYAIKGNHILNATNFAKQQSWSLFRCRAARDERAQCARPALVKDANIPDGRIVIVAGDAKVRVACATRSPTFTRLTPSLHRVTRDLMTR